MRSLQWYKRGAAYSIYPRSVISIYRAKIATNTGIQEDTLCFLRVFIGLSSILLTSIYHSQTFSTYFARISQKTSYLCNSFMQDKLFIKSSNVELWKEKVIL